MRNLLILVFAILSIAFTRADAQSLDDIANYRGADRQQRLVEGAKKDGMLTLYTTVQAEYLKQLTDPFEKMYGVKVNTWRSSGDTLLQKVVSEARGNNPVADVISFNALSMEALRREELLQTVWSPYHKDLAATALPPHRQWVSAFQLVFVQAYNTEKIRKQDLPKTYSDLLDPKWKGKIGIEASDHEWVAAVIADLGHEKGTALFKGLFTTNAMSVRKGHPLGSR